MDLFDVELVAGIENQISIEGRYFRILDGEGLVTLKTSNGKQSKIKPGIGVDLGRFEWFRLTSAQNQTVTILVSELPTTDNRAGGVMNTIPQAAESFNGLPQITIDGNAQTIAGYGNRKRLVILADKDNEGVIWIGSSQAGVGIPLPAGGIFDEAISGDLSLIGTSAGDVLNMAEVR